jgi:hypothetical protein
MRKLFPSLMLRAVVTLFLPLVPAAALAAQESDAAFFDTVFLCDWENGALCGAWSTLANPELCNGFDDDCDLAVDNGAALFCPGTDGLCQTRTCESAMCGLFFEPFGTPVGTQTAGDCQSHACDGGGAETDLIDNADVPVDGNVCTADLCQAGVPSNVPEPKGTPVGTQTVGDCQVNACDGEGGQTVLEDDSDIPDDSNQCTEDFCAQGAPGHNPTPMDFPCAQNGGAFCDGIGNCVECNSAVQCPGPVTECEQPACTAGTCDTVFAPSGFPCTGGTCDGLGNCTVEP